MYSNLNLSTQNIFYITMDAERASGLEDFANLYVISHKYNKQTHDTYNDRYISIEKNFEKYYQDINSIESILELTEIVDYIYDLSKGKKIYIQLFKPQLDIEEICIQYGWELITPKYDLSTKLENKLEFDKICKELSISTPKNVIQKLTEELPEYFKFPIVVQFPTGHTGDRSYIVNDITEFDKLKNKFPNVLLKISEYIEGIVLNVNCCITTQNNYIAGLNQQLIDHTCQLAPKTTITIGNNYDIYSIFKDRTDEITEEILKLTNIFANYLENLGYLGLFGLDIITKFDYEKQNYVYYVIEMNPRQTGNITYLTKLQKAQNQIPLIHLAILDKLNLLIEHLRFLHLSRNNSLNIDFYNKLGNLTQNYAQIIVRNYKTKDLDICTVDGYGRNVKEKILNLKQKYKDIDLILSNYDVIKLSTEIFRIQGKNLCSKENVNNELFSDIINVI